jgi:hypothetical protein
MADARYIAMAFHEWIVKHGWTKHSSGDYWYRSKNHNQWPPDESLTEEELLDKFFGKN